MIDLFKLTSSIRRVTPLVAWTRQGAVRPGARIFGGYSAGGRAP
jgi:hypothetical protein